MAFKLYEDTWETSTTTGTGTLTLAGAVASYRTFASQYTNADTTYYTIYDGTDFEHGLGTYTGGTLARNTVYRSTNGGNRVNWGAGTRQVTVAPLGVVLDSLLTPGSTGTPRRTADNTWAYQAAGQFVGTATNDDAAAGNVGEVVKSIATLGSSTVTISQASPGIVSWAAHGLNIGSPVHFTTSGALPTGLSVGTNYWISSQSFTANSFAVSTSVDNALAGTSVNTSSAGSGTHTALSEVINANGVAVNVTGISLTAGDWDIAFRGAFSIGATTILAHPTYASASATSATADLSIDRATSIPIPQAGTTGGGGFNAIGNPVRFSLSVTSTIYLVANASFTVSTCVAGGYIRARRAR